VLLSFVFSFRNEAENIPELVKRVHNTVISMDDVQYEMIFVNDDSTDRSLQLLMELQSTYPISIINMSRKFGVAPCVLAGMAHSRGDAVIYMDSDLQDPPEIIPHMVQKFQEGSEVVHTTRLQRAGENPAKMAITALAYRIINYLSDISLPVDTGDFKLLSSKVVKELVSLKEFNPYLRGLAVWVGYRQAFVFYHREPRFKGKTKFPLFSKGPVKEFLKGLTAFSSAPLYLSFILGAITIFLAFGLIVYAVVTKLLGISAPGVSSVLVAIAFFSGVILMTNGFLGLYIAQIYYEVKGRPRYIIKSIIESKNHKTNKDDRQVQV
jgi:glycosyltransferase involved in cell wall biosynthesis